MKKRVIWIISAIFGGLLVLQFFLYPAVVKYLQTRGKVQSRIVFEIDLPAFLSSQAKKRDPLFQKVLQETFISPEKDISDFAYNLSKQGLSLADYYGDAGQDEAEVFAQLDVQKQDAIVLDVDVLQQRIEKMELYHSKVQILDKERFALQLYHKPGAELSNLLGSTGLLEFRLLYDTDSTGNILQRIDRRCQSDHIITRDHLVRFQDRYENKNEVSLEDLFGQDGSFQDSGPVVDTAVFEENPFFSLLRVTGFGDIAVPIKNQPVVLEVLNSCAPSLLSDCDFFWSQRVHLIGEQQYRLLYFLESETRLFGKYLKTTELEIGNDRQPVLNMEFDETGTRLFSDLTRNNIDRQLAILFDGKVISAPVIKEHIPGGRVQITGIESMEEAKTLEIILSAGNLAAPVKILSITPVEEGKVTD